MITKSSSFYCFSPHTATTTKCVCLWTCLVVVNNCSTLQSELIKKQLTDRVYYMHSCFAPSLYHFSRVCFIFCLLVSTAQQWDEQQQQQQPARACGTVSSGWKNCERVKRRESEKNKINITSMQIIISLWFITSVCARSLPALLSCWRKRHYGRAKKKNLTPFHCA